MSAEGRRAVVAFIWFGNKVSSWWLHVVSESDWFTSIVADCDFGNGCGSFFLLTELRELHRLRVVLPSVRADGGGLPTALIALTRKDENRLVFEEVDLFIFIALEIGV